MGVAGLLKMISSCVHEVELSAYRGRKIAVDASCWLHRGTFACPIELAAGEPTVKFLGYCERMIELMRQHGVTPVLVFDGAPPAMKARLNEERRAQRAAHRAKADALLAQGKRAEAVSAMSKAVGVRPHMTQQLIELCRARGVEFIVAPYEADAQLAYLVEHGHCAAAVTEDSDLLAYGCPRTLYKLDHVGRAQLVALEDLQHAEDPQGRHLFAGEWPDEAEAWRSQLFTDMCILAGTDYLPSVYGVGLKSAHTALRRQRGGARGDALRRAATQLHEERARKSGGCERGEELQSYLANVRRVQQVFRHQRVFDPASGRVVPLRPLPADADAESMEQIGPPLDAETARQVSHTAAASATSGCSLRHLGLQPPSPTVAVPVTSYSCSPRHLRLQHPSPTVAGVPRGAPRPMHDAPSRPRTLEINAAASTTASSSTPASSTPASSAASASSAAAASASSAAAASASTAAAASASTAAPAAASGAGSGGGGCGGGSGCGRGPLHARWEPLRPHCRLRRLHA
jgi:exonuclease-1